MNTIAIDCGATFLKGALICDGVIRASRRVSVSAAYASNNLFDVSRLENLIVTIKQMIQDLSKNGESFYLCISNEMHGFLLVYEDGTPFVDYISWQQELGAIPIDGQSSRNILEQMAEEDILFTGMPLRSGLPSCNLLYLSRSGVLKQAKSVLVFCTLGDYIILALSGKFPHSHPTNAAATGLFNLQSGMWNPALINCSGGTNIKFLPIGEESISFTMNEKRFHVLPAIGDQQAALLGAGLRHEESLSFNIGTGAQVSKLSPTLNFGKDYQVRPYFFGKYIKTLPHIPAGRALNVYFRFVEDILHEFKLSVSSETIWETILRAEHLSNGTNMICDISFFENAMSDRQEGAITHIGEYDLTFGNLFHSLFQQMGYNFINAAHIIEPDAINVKEIIFSGGIARKIAVIRSYILNQYPNVEVSVAEDETLVGLNIYANIHK